MMATVRFSLRFEILRMALRFSMPGSNREHMLGVFGAMMKPQASYGSAPKVDDGADGQARSSEYAQLFWAPFVVVGEGGSKKQDNANES